MEEKNINDNGWNEFNVRALNEELRIEKFLSMLEEGLYGEYVSRKTFIAFRDYKDNIVEDFYYKERNDTNFNNWVNLMIESGYPHTDETYSQYESIYESYYAYVWDFENTFKNIFSSNDVPVKKDNTYTLRKYYWADGLDYWADGPGGGENSSN